MSERASHPSVRTSRGHAAHDPSGATGVAAAAAGCVAARAIAGWRPRAVSEPAAAFAREAAAAAAPESAARARALLFAAARLAAFAEQVGLELSAEVLLDQAVIERFIVVAERTLSPATRRTLRTNLRALARARERCPRPAPVPLPRERAKAPYSDAQIAAYLALAEAQPTRARRMRASALICLGAGAGLIGSELRHLTGGDVIARSGGLVVAVGGPRARVVPVLTRFHEPLRAAAAFAGDGHLVGGSAPHRKNLTDTLCAALCRDAGLPRLEAGRLRSTWLVRCAQLIGLPAFMQAAGVRCSQRLGDLVSQLPAPDEENMVALLGAAG
jgi:integrase